MTIVTISQPYIPQYRVAFFEQLIESLAKNGIELRVLAGEPDSDQRARGDAARPEWATFVEVRRLALGGRSLTISSPHRAWAGSDAVVVGHAGSSLEAYVALAQRRMRVGLWGHIRSYVNKPNPIDSALERWQLNKADHVFAYTPGGALYAADAGVSQEKITTLMNAVDTSNLLRELETTTALDARDYVGDAFTPRGSTFCFIGGLDESKRIDFLAEALDSLWVLRPDIRVLIGGNGAQATLLDAAASRGQVRLLGYVTDREKALLAKASSAILMPGRIGLVATEALVLGLPVLTTDWPFHAPEAEYLIENQTRFSSKNDPISFANLIAEFADREPNLGLSGRAAPTLEAMVSNFSLGVHKLLG